MTNKGEETTHASISISYFVNKVQYPILCPSPGLLVSQG